MMLCVDLLPIEPLLLPFFDAYTISICSLTRTYKKSDKGAWLCSPPRLYIGVLLTKKGKHCDKRSREHYGRKNVGIAGSASKEINDDYLLMIKTTYYSCYSTKYSG